MNRILLYKYLEKFVCTNILQDSDRLYQHLIFFTDGVAATNKHQILFVKQSNAESHLESVDGNLSTPEIIPASDKHQGYATIKDWLTAVVRPRFTRTYPKSLCWSNKISQSYYANWKIILDMVKRLSRIKNRFGTLTTAMLAKEGTNLVAYASKGDGCSGKFYLYDNCSGTVDWHCPYDANFLYNVAGLAIDAKIPELTVSVSTGTYPLLVAECNEFWALSAATLDVERHLLDFYESSRNGEQDK